MHYQFTALLRMHVPFPPLPSSSLFQAAAQGDAGGRGGGGRGGVLRGQGQGGRRRPGQQGHQEGP